MNNLNTLQPGQTYDWALMADGQPVQLFRSQSEALKAWRLARKRRGNITDFSVGRIIGLFDAP